ncbi:Uncharacterized protein LSUE1_G010228 [Lachnellula suecica]|uniref:Oxidoreductase n=1 Tax=Lachnellula suecica TaxID=602035 RepID=A0A8T9BWG4_9HELO|nr:Uncharacterized protein LSUE1_G010228 [Lachnellula suecica]
MLNSATACREFLETEDPSTVAAQIRKDQESCKAGKLPSILALYLKRLTLKQADLVASQLCPKTAKYSQSLKMMQYSGIIENIKAYSKHMGHEYRLEPLPSVTRERPNSQPSIEDYETTLKVLAYIQNQGAITASTSLGHTIAALNDTIKTRPNHSQDQIPQVPIFTRDFKSNVKPRRKCYICQYWLATPHPQYKSICKPCGDFNLASSDLSLPPNLQVDGQTALVTGARIHLGFHTALRLLRSGAKVIITSRYPRDAQLRYLAEEDSEKWCNELRIIGADFRAARDVFQLVEVTKNVLKEWDIEGVGKLDVLINNAAQTWTDPVQKELDSIEREHQLLLEGSDSQLILPSDYGPRVRGGSQDTEPLITLSQLRQEISKAIHDSPLVEEHTSMPHAISTNDNTTGAAQNQNEKCSWFQTLHEIPYEDIISAHSVNTFVPLILIRELLPLMGITRSQTRLPLSTAPRAHIVNVSAREGIFEADPKSKHKNGFHVHTNLAKAALNMLTETEAWPAWRERRVAMNSVDPGYLSMPLEMEERGGVCPIGWEDGAGRVLWPIAVGERGEAVWGRFLKDYGAHDVDVGAGR